MTDERLSQVLEALDEDASEDELLKLGTRSALNKSSALYAPLPQPAARMEGLEHTDEVKVQFHPATGAFITMPTDE